MRKQQRDVSHAPKSRFVIDALIIRAEKMGRMEGFFLRLQVKKREQYKKNRSLLLHWHEFAVWLMILQM